ncbi:WD40 repeat domain-containing protein, partial [archaeon]
MCWSQYHEEDVLEGSSGAAHQRLFGISLRGFIFEADLGNRGLKNVSDSYGGAAWSLAASPRSASLFVGCEDGSVRLFSYTSQARLVYVRAFATGGGRVLCLAVHPVSRLLYAGCLDGSVRCLDEDSGRQVFRTSGMAHGAHITAHLTSLCVLPDSTHR